MQWDWDHGGHERDNDDLSRRSRRRWDKDKHCDRYQYEHKACNQPAMRVLEPAQLLLARPSISILDFLPGADAHLVKVDAWLHAGHKHACRIEKAHQPAHQGHEE